MASQTIDKLQVEIEASSKSLSSVFSSLKTQLSQLQKTINSIDTSKLTKLSNSTNNISINTSGVTKAQKDISNSVSKIEQSLAGLESYKNAALSGDSSSLTSFNRRVVSIQSSIDVLKEKMSQLGVTQVESTQFTQLKSQSEELETKLQSLQSKMDAFNNGSVSLNTAEFQQLTDDIKNTETALDEVTTKMQNMTLDGTAFINADTLTDQLQSAKDEVDAFVNSTNNAKPELDTSGISVNLSDIISNAKEAASSLWSMVSSGLKSGFSTMKNTLSGITSTLSKIGKTASSTVSTGFTKILKYGFGIRSMYVLFRRLRTAIKDAFTELQESGANVEETTANVNALKTALYTLKYQFGAAFEPIFNTVAPALETMINYLVAAMNTISAFIAKITGASTYSKAVVTMNSVADSAGSAASSTEDLNKQLQGFDELNNLSGDSDSGSGGSGSSSSDDYDVTYVEESVESALSSFWNTLADYIEAGDWFMVGRTIANELTEALDSIDWPSIWSTVSDWGTNLASFMNGLITTDLFTSLGTTIGNSIKTALTFLNSFGSEFNFTNFGNSIASAINAYVETNPLSLAVDTFNTWANGILDALIAAMNKISWSQIATNIADAIGNLDTSGFGERLGSLASSIANALYTLVSNKDTWSNLGTKIGEGIKSFFTSMGSTNSSTGLTGWAALGKTISSTISGFATTLTEALNTIDWEEVGQGIADFISNIDWDEIKFSLGNLLTALKNAIIGLIKGLSITPADLATFTFTITGLAVALTGISLVANITKQAITTAVTNKIAELIGTGGLSISGGSIGNVALSAAAIVAVSIAGWKIGGKIYESATGQTAPSLGEILSTLFSEGAFSDLISGIKLDLQSDASITADLSKVSSIVGLGTPSLSALSVAVNRLNVSTNRIVVDVDTSKTNSAMSFTNQISIDNLLGADFQTKVNEKGEEIVEGLATGVSNKASEMNADDWHAPMVRKSVEDAIEDEFEINSPAKTMYKYGSSIVEGIRDGISLNSTSSMFSTAISGVKTILDSLLSAAGLDDVDVSISATLETGVNTLKTWGGSFVDNITNKWTDVKSTVSAVLGGDIEDNGISTFTTWITGIGNLQSAWTGKKATFKADTGGQISNITDLGSWKTTFENLYNVWNSKKAEFTAQYGSNTSESIIGKMKQKIGELTSAWYGKDAKFTAGYGGDTNAKKIDGLKSAISGLTGTSGLWHSVNAVFTAGYGQNTSSKTLKDMKDAIDPLVSSWKSPGTATFNASFNKDLGTMEGYKNAIKGIYDNWQGRDATFNIWANIDSNLDTFASNLVDAINSKLKKSTNYKLVNFAEGGVLINGISKSIPQYAGGSLNAGSLFWAGEGGSPELVGHMNGRTEVLNKSQIASTMYSAMTSAMRNFGSPATPPTIRANGSVGTYNPNSANGSNSDALLMEQNRLIAQQNVLLERIAEKDTTISASDIFSAMRVESNNYYNRTGNSAFIGF